MLRTARLTRALALHDPDSVDGVKLGVHHTRLPPPSARSGTGPPGLPGLGSVAALTPSYTRGDACQGSNRAEDWGFSRSSYGPGSADNQGFTRSSRMSTGTPASARARRGTLTPDPSPIAMGEGSLVWAIAVSREIVGAGRRLHAALALRCVRRSDSVMGEGAWCGRLPALGVFVGAGRGLHSLRCASFGARIR